MSKGCSHTFICFSLDESSPEILRSVCVIHKMQKRINLEISEVISALNRSKTHVENQKESGPWQEIFIQLKGG